MAPVRAQDEPFIDTGKPHSGRRTRGPAQPPPSTLRDVFGDEARDDEDWRQSIKRAYEDPRVSPKRTLMQWVPKDPQKPDATAARSGLARFGEWMATIGEYGLWIVVGALVLVLLLTRPKWLGWCATRRDGVRRNAESPARGVAAGGAAARRRARRRAPSVAVRSPARCAGTVYRASVDAMTHLARTSCWCPAPPSAHAACIAQVAARRGSRAVRARGEGVADRRVCAWTAGR
jgi:hypothetical protein